MFQRRREAGVQRDGAVERLLRVGKRIGQSDQRTEMKQLVAQAIPCGRAVGRQLDQPLGRLDVIAPSGRRGVVLADVDLEQRSVSWGQAVPIPPGHRQLRVG